MEQTFAFYGVAAFSVVLTGLSKSGFGGGLGVMSVPMMSLFVSPQFAAAVMMPILLAMDVLVVWRYRRTWDLRIIGTLLPAALIGLVIGSMAFQYVAPDTIRLFVGILAAFFVIQFVLTQMGQGDSRATPRPIVWGLGMLSGFSSFVAHAGGPPVKGYLLQQQLEKSWFVGTNTMFFFSLNFLKTFAYGATGTLSSASLHSSALLAPLIFVGVFLGVRLHGLIDQARFIRAVYFFLTLAAAKLLYDGSSALLA